MHEQTKTLLRSRAIPWYRTDANGDVVIRVPGRGRFTITPSRGTTDASGPSDRRSSQAECK
jgi:beta-lactamase superfamily II metal-dependent hydrolase